MEHSATIAIYARLLGGPVPFSSTELQKLYDLRGPWGVQKQPLDCTDAGSCSVQSKERLSEAGYPANTCGAYSYDESAAAVSRMSAVSKAEPVQPVLSRPAASSADDIDMERLVDIIVDRVKSQLTVS